MWVLLRSQSLHRLLERRIGMIAVLPLVQAEHSVRIGAIGDALRRGLTLGASHRWGMHAASPLLIVLVMAGFTAALVLLRSVFGLSPLAAIIGAGLAAVVLPRAVLRHQQVRAETAFVDRFPDTIDMVIRMLRAGLPVSAIMRVVGREAPAPVGPVFGRLADQIEIGLPFSEVLAAASRRIGLADFRFFAMAVSLQSDTGGNLATTLEMLSTIIRKRREVRLQARSSTAEVRVSAWLLGGLPFLVTGLLLLTNPAYLTPLITDPRGNLIVLAAGTMLIMGLGAMRQMMRQVTRL